MASTEIAIISAGSCRKMFANIATSSSTTPMNRNLPMPDRSRLVVVAIVAIAAKITPVPPNAMATSEAPLESPSTTPSMRESSRPMKNVKASRSTMPQPLFWCARCRT